MSTATLTEAHIASAEVTDSAIITHLTDGRTVSVPIEWSWRLKDATPEQRLHWEMIGDGQGIRWPDVDEDISVEGMLRGVPSKRPSRTELRILLDASSLIDAEHKKPVTFSELDKMLREHHARLILTYTSVIEFAAPFEKTQDRLALRGQLQQVDQLPIGYLREGGIKLAELREAIRAFSDNRECAPIDPYVKRWDETLVLEGNAPAAMLVNQSLYDLVSMAMVGGNPLRHAKERWDLPLKEQFESDRALPPAERWDPAEHFRMTILRHLNDHSIEFPPDQASKLADWIFANPATRCPGYRIAWEVRRELMRNTNEKVSGNDMFDIAHLRAIPYVDAMTMDSNTAAHCRNVTKRLKKLNPAINYEDRIFTNLEALLAAKF